METNRNGQVEEEDQMVAVTEEEEAIVKTDNIAPSKGATQNIQNRTPIYFPRKSIRVGKRHTSILLQDANGPCPLVSIFNALMLRGTPLPEFDERCDRVSDVQLMHILADAMLDRINKNAKMANNENVSHSVEEVMQLLPRMLDGLDVNVKFTGIRDFEPTAEMSIFDLFNLILVHGWLVDPQDADTSSALCTMSYNQAVEKVFLMDDLLSVQQQQQQQQQYQNIGEQGEGSTDVKDPSHGTADVVIDSVSHVSSISQIKNPNDLLQLPEEKRNIILREGNLIREFLGRNPTQLTIHGLHSLREGLKERSLGILFRNNHFSTIVRREGQLYILCTDAGFMSHHDLIWQSFQDVDGQHSEYYTGSFQQYRPNSRASQMGTSEIRELKRQEEVRSKQEEADKKLAMQLQGAELRENHHQQASNEQMTRQESGPHTLTPHQQRENLPSRIPTTRERREMERSHSGRKKPSNDRYKEQASKLRKLNEERNRRQQPPANSSSSNSSSSSQSRRSRGDQYVQKKPRSETSGDKCSIM